MDPKVPKPIRKLDEVVVNRIAAGEVIQRPANALKEMIENCLDAKASSIQIMVKDGGLKLMQIKDDGTGIRKEDLDIVCERFTTSKLQQFEDLQTIQTYGFRGEALASISHVAHVTILTKTADAKCAFKVSYSDGKPLSVPKPSAGNNGTVITVEDLFYNMPIRRKAFASPASEYVRIEDVVSRYAIHNANVGFSLKKNEGSISAVKTAPNSTVTDNVRLIYGTEVAKDLMEIECDDKKHDFRVKGYISNCNYGAKKVVFLLFINHRLVESTVLRKAIEAVYSAYLPKSKFPFVYLSLEIASQNIDVNVHPTKQEVHFLYEDSIVEAIQKLIESNLLNTNQSRTIYLQTKLPITAASSIADESEDAPERKTYPQHTVRTDSREQKLDAYMGNTGSTGRVDKQKVSAAQEKTGSKAQKSLTFSGPLTSQTTMTGSSSKPRQLKSVAELMETISSSCETGLRSIFQQYTFVGCVDPQYSLIQHQTKLYLLNTCKLSQQLFYQIMIRDFGNFGIIRLSKPASLFNLAMLALECHSTELVDSYGSKENLANYAVELLKSKSDMLKDYFSLEIDAEGNLRTLPYLLKSYRPSLIELPSYILFLVTEVNWKTEKECFHKFCLKTSEFYAFSKFEQPQTKDKTSENASTQDSQEEEPAEPEWKWTVEHVLFPAFREVFQPAKEAGSDGSILQIANLPDLYKVFERC